MKKLLNVFLVVLLILGMAVVSQAASIPQSERGNEGPAPWYIPVYNNSGSDFDAGDVVTWDIGSSTGDNDNYVTTTTASDTLLVAGVVWPNAITAGDTGTIAIKGVVECDIGAQGVGAGGPLCTSATTGGGDQCTT